jgi:hypothetical protein
MSDQDIIQSICGFSGPQAVWEVVDKYTDPKALLSTWANSYYQGFSGETTASKDGGGGFIGGIIGFFQDLFDDIFGGGGKNGGDTIAQPTVPSSGDLDGLLSDLGGLFDDLGDLGDLSDLSGLIGGLIGGGGTPTPSVASPTLTITGLPGENWMVTVYAAGADISTLEALSDAMDGDADAMGFNVSGNDFNLYDLKVASGISERIDDFDLSFLGSISSIFWKGSGSRQVLLLNPDGDFEDPFNPANPMWRHATVNFSNGSATVPFRNFIPVVK